jgi:hypothetical protein
VHPLQDREGRRTMNLSQRIDTFCKLPFAEQKEHARKLNLVREGDEKRTNMAEICLWTIRAEIVGKTDELFYEQD